ncbi:MAG: hypothetical protein HYV63_02965 [Candidatus Schekmanbacteria bacterium]|nr:hypothetical protein [Candidatus Schekmanbacteria bacterium]
MYLESKEIVPHPADLVYPLVRDEMQKIVPYLPNIERIDTVQREDRGDGRHYRLNHWYAVANLPRFLSGIIKPEFFAWKDFAEWRDAGYCVDYRLEGFWLTELYTCSGTNFFQPVDAEHTEIKITCGIEIYPDRVPGVPKLIVKRAMPAIEAMVRQLLEPNLTSLATGIKGYFDAQGKPSL